MTNEKSTENELPQKTFKEFLESTPPSSSTILTQIRSDGKIDIPDIKIYCESKDCKREQWFSDVNYSSSFYAINQDTFINYCCKNCEKTYRTFAIHTNVVENKMVALKYGEIPPFGPHIPSKTIELIGLDRDIFLKGYRCENQGLGIGAFAYYRRVVENQKNRIIDEMIKAVEKIDSNSESINWLKQIKEESQFTKATKDLKKVLPSGLLIDGCHNPLFLIYTALSEGIHNQSDKKCLELSHTIRLVLTDLAKRISLVLSEHKELTNAVILLTSSNNKNRVA